MVDKFIDTHYGEIPREKRIAIATTFELLWDKYGYRYAEFKTLKKYQPTPPILI